MENKYIRWQQRLSNFSKALKELSDAVDWAETRALNKLEKQGLIQAFEYTHELAWKTLKDFFAYRGNSEIFGSRDAFNEAFQAGIITDGEVWMDMIKSRNETSHAYDEAAAAEVGLVIVNRYFGQFQALEQKLTELKEQVKERFLGLSEDNLQRINTVLTQFKRIDKAVVYGSRAKGNYKPGSDIDLCLYVKNIDLSGQYKIETALDDLFLPYKFDVTIYEKITNMELKNHIDRIGKQIYPSKL